MKRLAGKTFQIPCPKNDTLHHIQGTFKNSSKNYTVYKFIRGRLNLIIIEFQDEILKYITGTTEKIYPPERGNVRLKASENGEVFEIQNLAEKDEGQYFCSSKSNHRIELQIRKNRRRHKNHPSISWRNN